MRIIPRLQKSNVKLHPDNYSILGYYLTGNSRVIDNNGSLTVSKAGCASEERGGAGKRAGDFRWMEAGTNKAMVELEKDLARSYWQRWRKEQRFATISKKRSRNGSPVRMKTTSMMPPWSQKDDVTVGGTVEDVPQHSLVR